MTQSYDNWLQEPYYEDYYCEECGEWYNEKKGIPCDCYEDSYEDERSEEWEE